MRKLTAVAALAALSACTNPDRRAAQDASAAGGTMILTVPAEPPAIFPAFIQDASGANIHDQLFERLAEIGDDLSTVGDRGFTPRLADRWTWASDSMSIAFHIDPRARWHDDVPVRASDVRYSFDVVKNPKSSSSITSLIGNIDSVTVRDSMTAVAWFHTRRPEQFYDFVYQVYIVPEHVTGSIPVDKLASAPEIRRGIGSGPFRLGQWKAGERIELLADTANYRGRPRLDRVVYLVTPDPATQLTQLLAGQSDMMEFIPADNLAEVDSSRTARLMPYPSLQYVFLSFNGVDPKRMSQPHPVLGDRAVRRALSMAIDRRAMVENVFNGRAPLSRGPFPRSLGVADTTIALIPYDTAAAAALLDSAGWRLPPDGGVRRKNGRPLRFNLLVPSSSKPRMAFGILLQEALRKVGVEVDLDQVQGSVAIQRQLAHDFDACIIGIGIDPSPSTYKQQWSTEGTARGGQNWGMYRSARFDATLDSALIESDPVLARALMRRAFEIQVADAPAVWLYDVPTTAGLNRRIEPGPLRADAWWAHLDRWSIPATARIDRDRIGLGPAR